MKQLIVIADMEGASGIFDSNAEAFLHEELYPQNKAWRAYGRSCITSDVLAVCSAAIDAESTTSFYMICILQDVPNQTLCLNSCPPCVRCFDLPDRLISSLSDSASVAVSSPSL